MAVSCGYFKANEQTALTTHHRDLAWPRPRRYGHPLCAADIIGIRALSRRPDGGGRRARPHLGGQSRFYRVLRKRGIDRDHFGGVVGRADKTGTAVTSARCREHPSGAVDMMMAPLQPCERAQR